jgi:acetyl esterase/lipase
VLRRTDLGGALRAGTVPSMSMTMSMRTVTATFLAAAFAAPLAGCGDGAEPTSTTEVMAGASQSEPIRVEYADHDDGFGELWLPQTAREDDPAAIVVLVHGGYWQRDDGLDLMDPLVTSLLDLGLVVWNIEYRRVGAGGGYPETFEDVAAAFDVLGSLPPEVEGLVDTVRVVAVGHSAGGQLAVWAAGRPQLPDGARGAGPLVTPGLVVSQAGVLDLASCARTGLGGGACVELVGERPEDAPDRFALTSPIELVPIDVPVVAVHGTLDVTVPIDQSARYVDAAVAAGGDASLVRVDGEDHFDQLDPRSASWSAVLGELADWAADPSRGS